MQRDRLLLADMLEVASRITEVIGDHSPESFAADRLVREALLWNFTVLGEAASQLSPELRDRHPEVGWRDPIDLRNRVVHGYASVDLDIVYGAATIGVPELVDALRSMIETEFPEAGE